MIRRLATALLRELRAYLGVLGTIATLLFLTFLAGAFVGTFVWGCKAVAGLAP